MLKQQLEPLIQTPRTRLSERRRHAFVARCEVELFGCGYDENPGRNARRGYATEKAVLALAESDKP
jgi:hypothetical protein